ncbi:het domain protein [Stagonosporopsis vannaccii]|nr:het domain protein [Stagonosporopsis vannaccii]
MIYSERLSEHDIRLLTVLPSQDEGAPITCEIHRYKTSAAPPYEGLSYAWGDPSNVAPVVCNGIEVQVTRSLRNALLRVRDIEIPKIIWADALCMNQNDIQEKNIQVPLMGRVFSQATNTVIYLGEASQCEAVEAEAGLDAILDFMEEFTQQTGLPFDSLDTIYEHILEMLSRKPLPSLSWSSIEDLFNAAWFSRTWCVQEILLARDSVLDSYVMYGHIRISYQRVAKVALFLIIADQCGFDFARKLAISGSIALFGTLDLSYPEQPGLIAVLALFFRHLASDPRDKVYGVLGILLHRFGYNLDGIVVDYTRSVAQVYTDTAIEIIRIQQNLELLDYIAHPNGFDSDAELPPTWVPRWDQPLSWSLFISNDSSFRSNCSASKLADEKVPISWEVQGDRLLVSGFQYERVARVLSLKDANAEVTFKNYWERTQTTRSSCFDRQEELFVFARTLTIGHVGPLAYFNRANDSQNQAFMADFFAYVHQLMDYCCSNCPGRPEDDMYTIDANGTKRMGLADRYATLLEYRCRSFFETAEGSFGIGPEYLLPGDVIVGIMGENSPSALRAKDKDYLILGSIYIDGLMDGKHFRGMLDKGMKEQFTLI